MNVRSENARLVSAKLEKRSHLRDAESKLDESRAELQHLFDDDEQRSPSRFPRSKTARFLTSNKGLALLAIIAGGVLIARPRLAKRAFRWMPVASLGRMAASRIFMPRDRD